MDIEEKQHVLKQLYNIHDNVMAQETSACNKGCAACCTVNVTMTTLEGLHIIHFLDDYRKKEVNSMLQKLSDNKKYRPDITTNGFADLCVSGEEIPDEENDPKWGTCPFLEDDLCTIYPVRPLGCRSLMSSNPCNIDGFADMAPDIMTINTIFLQFVEHMDGSGYYGNMTDILLFMLNKECPESYIHPSSPPRPQHLLTNLPIKMLLVPPEHRKRAMPVIQAIQNSGIEEFL